MKRTAMILNKVFRFRLRLTGSFTLVETMIALVVFVSIAGAASVSLSLAYLSWRRQRVVFDLASNARWALEHITNAVRNGGDVNAGVVGGVQHTLCVEVDTDGDFSEDTRIWYWRGTTVGMTNYGSPDVLYRGVDPSVAGGYPPSLNTANSNRKELANFVTDNPGGNNIFRQVGSYYVIELTLQDTVLDANTQYLLRTEVRPRN